MSMPNHVLAVFCLWSVSGLPAMAQSAPNAPKDAAVQAAQQPADPPRKPPADGWRDTSRYPFPALSTVVAAAQNMAYAMTLRDYCADARVSPEFVQERLARFSKMTGREETCPSLLDY